MLRPETSEGGDVGIVRAVGMGGDCASLATAVAAVAVRGASPDENMGSDDPVRREAAVAAAATLQFGKLIN
jgi:hypothetical protein